MVTTRACRHHRCCEIDDPPTLTDAGYKVSAEPAATLQAILEFMPDVIVLALNSCHSHKANSGPSIEFSHNPPAAQGGPERVGTISGRVRNVRPKQQIVIYAHSGQGHVATFSNSLGFVSPAIGLLLRRRPMLKLVTPSKEERCGCWPRQMCPFESTENFAITPTCNHRQQVGTFCTSGQR